MKYQVDHEGNIIHCRQCREPLRSSPVYDSWPICMRTTCKNQEQLGRDIHDALVDVFGPAPTHADEVGSDG